MTGDEFLARRLAPRIGVHIDVDKVLCGIAAGLTAARDRSEMVAAARRAAATIVDEPNVDSLAERIAMDAMASRTDDLARIEGLAYGLRHYFGDQLAVYVNKILRGAALGMPPGTARPRFAVTGITFYAAVLIVQGRGLAPNAHIVEVHCGRRGRGAARRSPSASRSSPTGVGGASPPNSTYASRRCCAIKPLTRRGSNHLCSLRRTGFVRPTKACPRAGAHLAACFLEHKTEYDIANATLPAMASTLTVVCAGKYSEDLANALRKSSRGAVIHADAPLLEAALCFVLPEELVSRWHIINCRCSDGFPLGTALRQSIADQHRWASGMAQDGAHVKCAPVFTPFELSTRVSLLSDEWAVRIRCAIGSLGVGDPDGVFAARVRDACGGGKPKTLTFGELLEVLRACLAEYYEDTVVLAGVLAQMRIHAAGRSCYVVGLDATNAALLCDAVSAAGSADAVVVEVRSRRVFEGIRQTRVPLEGPLTIRVDTRLCPRQLSDQFEAALDVLRSRRGAARRKAAAARKAAH